MQISDSPPSRRDGYTGTKCPLPHGAVATNCCPTAGQTTRQKGLAAHSRTSISLLPSQVDIDETNSLMAANWLLMVVVVCLHGRDRAIGDKHPQVDAIGLGGGVNQQRHHEQLLMNSRGNPAGPSGFLPTYYIVGQIYYIVGHSQSYDFVIYFKNIAMWPMILYAIKYAYNIVCYDLQYHMYYIVELTLAAKMVLNCLQLQW